MNVRSFPPHLLMSTNEVRLAYFHGHIANHPAMELAEQALNEGASGLLEQRLILLLGAAGVGKSELLKQFIQKRILLRSDEMKYDLQRVPGLFVELEAPVTGSFTFLPFYKEAFGRVGSVLAGKTLGCIDRLAGKSVLKTVHIEAAGRKSSGEDFKARFTETLVDRKVEICGLDEAVNAFKTANSLNEEQRDRAVTDQANRIKSLVNKSATTFILVGAFDFYQLTVGSAQLARRSQIVHLKPYGARAKDLEGFLSAFTDLLAHLPIIHGIDPELHAVELFLQSLGCVGHLKNILKTALNKALMRNQTVDIKLLKECYFSAPALLKMKTEQEEGIAGLDFFLSLEELAGEAAGLSHESSQVSQSDAKTIARPALKPGETKPSNRRAAADAWE